MMATARDCKVIEVTKNGMWGWHWRIIWRDDDTDETLVDGNSETEDAAWRAARLDFDDV